MIKVKLTGIRMAVANKQFPASLCRAVATALYSAFLLSGTAFAAEMYYDPGVGSGSDWVESRWGVSEEGPYTQGWVDGSTAVFSTGYSISHNISADIVVGGITALHSGVTFTGVGGVPRINLDGATLWAPGIGSSNSIVFYDYAAIEGNFVVEHGGLELGNHYSLVSVSGTITVKNGAQVRIEARDTETQYADANFILGDSPTGSTEMLMRVGYGIKTLGTLTINDGTFEYGHAVTALSASVTVSALSGAGGRLKPREGNYSGELVHTFNVNQNIDTVFSGDILGEYIAPSTRRGTTFTKSGSGTLTLDGETIELLDGMYINEGAVVVNGVGVRNFGNIEDIPAIEVRGTGVLGGDSILDIVWGGVFVEFGGGLSPGAGAGLIGTLTLRYGVLVLGEGQLNLIFDLGSDVLPGETYDQVQVVGESFFIGKGTLNFDDFVFHTQEGFDVGTYTLFALIDSDSTGWLGENNSGMIGDHHYGTLALTDEGLILRITAVPEPNRIALVLALAGLLATRCPRRSQP